MKDFDKKFGKSFVSALPTSAGIYRVYDFSGRLIYVGKAKNLRTRLSQYRNTKRLKKHLKMRSIVKDASRIEIETCSSDLEACLLENRLIQEKRPKWNTAGAFHFLYPMIGVRFDQGVAYFCYTTSPDHFKEFRFHGAYRSRLITRDAFLALMDLMPYLGHRQRGVRSDQKYSYVFAFRQISSDWLKRLESFLNGTARDALGELVLAMLENAGARKKSVMIQENLDSIKRFWRLEAVPLAKALKGVGDSAYPVPQADRDRLFLKYKLTK